jgi:hypothetical protein
MQSPSLEWIPQVSSARLQLELRPRPASMVKTPSNFSSQLHQWLEGKAILIGNLLEMDTPLNYFSSGNHNELSDLHKQLTKIGKMLGTIDSEWMKFKQALEEEQAN